MSQWLQSYSGVRAKVGLGPEVDLDDELFALRHAYCYAASRLQVNPATEARIVMARDPRPTGRAFVTAQAEGIESAFRDFGVRLELLNLGIVSTPVWQHAVRLFEAHGGVMVSASHNPLDNNGWKYATGVETHAVDPAPPGALLSAAEMGMLIKAANAFRPTPRENPTEQPESDWWRERAIAHYTDFIHQTYRGETPGTKVVLDPNGGAACGIARRVFERLGVETIVMNEDLGSPAHEIDVELARPDGSHVLDGLAARVRDEGAAFGLAFDYDADRGNLTYVDAAGAAAIPSPQMAAAINTAIALAVHRRSGDPRPPAVVASDATSYRVHQIARAFGAHVAEVETGEVNVVTRMGDLEREGYRAVVGVEGPNGGTIFAGTTCRDGSLVGAGALLAAADQDLRRLAAEGLGLVPEAVRPGLLGFAELLPKQRTLASRSQTEGLEWGALVNRLEERFARAFPSLDGWDRYVFHYAYTRSVGPDRPYGKTYGWKVRLYGGEREGFLWVRGSKTELGLVRVVADAPTVAGAERLLALGNALLG